MVRFSFYKSSAASFDKVSTKILRTHGIAVNESIEVEVGFDEPSVVRRTHSYPSGYITETFSNEQETDDADDEKKQVRITATADTDTWVSHSSSDIPSDLGHSQSGTEEWSSEQSDAFDGFSDGIPSIATACNGSEEEEEDVDVIVDAIAKCNFDIVWSGDSVVCVDEGDANTSNPREEEELVNEKEAVHEVTDKAFICVVGKEDNTNLKDGSEKDVKELCINKDSKIELNNSDDIAKEESVVENDNIEESSDNNVDIDDTSADKTESTADNLFKENSREDCAIDLDSNENSTVGVVRTVATSDKLTAMMCERISAINNIRGLIEQESETSKFIVSFLFNTFASYNRLLYCVRSYVISIEEDIIFEFNNRMMLLKHDVKCKDQANKEIMKTVKYLKTKNSDYARQLCELSSTVDSLVASKDESIHRMNAMKQELTSKKVVIDELKVDIESKDTFLEEMSLEIVNLAEKFQLAITKNEQLQTENNGLKTAINDLVISSKENIQQITVLENDVATKLGIIDEMSGLKTNCEKVAAENAALFKQLEVSKVENTELKATIDNLESNYAIENETMITSLQEMVDLNISLQTQVDKAYTTIEDMEKVNSAKEKKNTELLSHFSKSLEDLTKSLEEKSAEIEANDERSAELLDMIESVTKVLQNERAGHEKEVEELKKMLKMEMEDKADIIRKTEKSLKNVAAQMTTELAAEKQIFDATINDLTKSIEKLVLDNKEASSQSKELRARIEGGKNAATKVSKDLAETINQLEKDLEEEFQITTQLKNGAEELIVKHVADKNANLIHEIEGILGDVRMIQCWQLSHFQLITKLISENKEQVRSVRLL